MDQKKGKSRIRGIIILVLLAVMLVSGAMSIRSWMEDKRTREEYERLAELARETTAQPSTEAETEPGTAEPETEPYVSPINFEELMRENPDTIGWIRVPDTNIDYPIVQGEDNDFYLNHDFYGKDSDNTIENGRAFDFDVTGKLAGHYDIQLIGSFNQENAVAAGLACLRLGTSLADIQKGIAQTSVPGRMEVITQTNGAKVFVDYAHNGDSLEKLLSVVEEHQKGDLHLILGATGNREKAVVLTLLVSSMLTQIFTLS